MDRDDDSNIEIAAHEESQEQTGKQKRQKRFYKKIKENTEKYESWKEENRVRAAKKMELMTEEERIAR